MSMREILFRGKRADNGEWVEGYVAEHTLIPQDLNAYVGLVIEGKPKKAYDNNFCYVVDPATVGQYTGLTDENGKKIFEGDIVEVYGGRVYHVLFDEGRGGWYPFACGDGCGCCEYETEIPSHSIVIGNIHDNPELLKGAQE